MRKGDRDYEEKKIVYIVEKVTRQLSIVKKFFTKSNQTEEYNYE